MWEVAMATTAAPTFFPAYRLKGDGVRLIDGGVWANNPAMVGVTEAVSLFGRKLDDIRVLSLGTTSSARARSGRLDSAGLLRWATGPNIVDVLLAGQGAGAFAQVSLLVGKENALRIDPPTFDGEAPLDGNDADQMIAKAAHHGRSVQARIRKEVWRPSAPTVPTTPWTENRGKSHVISERTRSLDKITRHRYRFVRHSGRIV